MNLNQLDDHVLENRTLNDFVRKAPIEAIQGILTVKFYTTDAKVFTQSIPGFYSIEHIKRNLARLFSCPASAIDLLLREQQLSDETILGSCEPDKFGILEIKLISKDRHFKIPIENAYKHLTVPDILTVKVQKDGGEFQEVVVEIENRAIEKPYLGGYRHPVSGIQYHHGYTQTGPVSPELPPEMKNHRDTQTYYMRNRKINKNCSKFTQVATKKIFIPTVQDKLLKPGPYETAEEREKRLDVEGKVKTIQRYFRAWQIKQRLKALSLEHQRQIDFEAECDEAELQQIKARKTKDIISKVFPLNCEDFSMLLNMVELWKKAELERIGEVACGAARMAESFLLLEKEIEIIQSIECLKKKVKNDQELKKVKQFFKEIGSPIEWISEYKEIHISMDTLEAQRGREYHELYKDLCKKSLSKDDGFKMYARIKEYLKTHKCSEGKEIISLIDRICQLTAMGISDKYLGALRKRIQALVLHHFQLQECNEGLTDHMKKISLEHSTRNLVYCHSCQKLKPIERFTIHARLKNLKICTACKRLNKAEEPWIDLAPHKFILRQIRNFERLHNGISSIVFILQDRDIHLIVNIIWHGHSAISECNDINQLRLIRWKKEEEWAPWNCILLTKEEAKAHLAIPDLETVYAQHLISHVFNKHALARKYFKHLTTYDNYYAKLKQTHYPCEARLRCKACLERERSRCGGAASIAAEEESQGMTKIGVCKACPEHERRRCCKADASNVAEEDSKDMTETTEISETTETTEISETTETTTTESSEYSLKSIFKNPNVEEPSDDY